jgi:HTH-type transcriptional regulator / antitoxin HipB
MWKTASLRLDERKVIIMRSAVIRNAGILGDLLVELRTRAGLSQRELAERLGVSQRYVVELEQGKQTKSIERLLAFVKTTGGALYLELGGDDA